MKGHRMPDMKEGNVNVTPLIDIVMCLIIFYMLVAKIGINQGTPEMKLPEASTGLTIEDKMNLVNLNVTQMGADARIEVLDQAENHMKTFTGSSVTQMMDLVRFLKAKKGQNAEFKAIIRAPQDTDYRFIQPVLLVISQAGVKEYAFEANKPKPK